MDSLRLETTLLNGSSSYVEFAGSYYVNPLEDEIAQPDGVPFDVLASSEEDYISHNGDNRQPVRNSPESHVIGDGKCEHI